MATYPFNPNIPAANNRPSDDQPDMLTNNSSTASLIAEDHVGFNTSNGGKHKQVRFQANISAPSIAGIVSALFANVGPTLSELFFVNSSKTVQLTGLPIGTTGTNYSIVSPWGITLNFGSKSTGGSGSYTVNFQTAVAAVYSIQLTPVGGAATVYVTSSTNSSVTFQQVSGGSSVYYFVIGRSV